MTCPVCGAKTKILDSRKRIDYVRRRRECVECGYRFTTEETEVRTSHKNRQKIMIEQKYLKKS